MGYLKICCWCCSLRTGTIIIGSLSLIYSTFFLCLTITALVLFQSSNDQMDAKTNNTYDSAMDAKTNGTYDSAMDAKTNQTFDFAKFFNKKSVTIGFLSMYAVRLSILVITSILLIFGAVKGRMGFLLPWIASASLGYIPFFFVLFFHLDRVSKFLTQGIIFVSILGVLAVLALEMHLLLVVISLYQELKENRRREASNIGGIYSTPSSRSQAQIIPNVPKKESA